jgi:hypothetical protein
MSGDAQTHRVDVLGTLVRREWLASGRLIIGFVVAWVLGMALELCFHPGILLAFGCLYAVVLGTVAGGGEAFAGDEEFTFAMPATRHQRYLARLLLAGSALVALQLLGIAAIALDLPQRLWGLVVESGFTEPFPPARPLTYWLAAALPIAGFATTFALAANGVGWPWFGGPLLAAVVMGLGVLAERGAWGEANGFLCCPALAVLAPLALLAGHRSYLHREGVARPATGRPGALMALAILLAVILVLAASSYVMVDRDLAEAPAEAVPAPSPIPSATGGQP